MCLFIFREILVKNTPAIHPALAWWVEAVQELRPPGPFASASGSLSVSRAPPLSTASFGGPDFFFPFHFFFLSDYQYQVQVGGLFTHSLRQFASVGP